MIDAITDLWIWMQDNFIELFILATMWSMFYRINDRITALFSIIEKGGRV